MSQSEISALNAEILRNIGIIAKDEGLLSRLAKYVRRLAKEKTNDPTLMTEEEFFSRIEEAETQYARGEYTTLLPGESVSEMLKRCGYDL